MQFREQIVKELDANPDQAVRDGARSLFNEIERTFEKGGPDGVAQLFDQKQSAIKEKFDTCLGKLRNGM